MKRLFLAIFLCIFPLFSLADNTINVTRGTVDPIPIAINSFRGVDPADTKIAQDVIAVISNDLKGSGIFRPISSAAFIESKIGTSHTPLFAAWQQINANLLLNGEKLKITRKILK